MRGSEFTKWFEFGMIRQLQQEVANSEVLNARIPAFNVERLEASVQRPPEIKLPKSGNYLLLMID